MCYTCRCFALAKYRICYHRLEIETRNDTKCTRNLCKTDSRIDVTQWRSKLKAIFYSNTEIQKAEERHFLKISEVI